MTKIWIKALLASRHLLLTTLHLIFHFFTTIPCLRQHFYPLDILVTNTRKFDHITPFLQELRWLPVRYYLMYTVGVLTFKCVKGIAPSYLTDRFVTRSTVHDRNTRNTRCGGRGWIKHQHLHLPCAPQHLPCALFETSSVMISCYGYEISRHKYQVVKPCLG